MSEYVCPNKFCTFAPMLRMINRREGGGINNATPLTSSEGITSNLISGNIGVKEAEPTDRFALV